MINSALQAQSLAKSPRPDAHDHWLGRAALRALLAELALQPKPGLVSFEDSGSHDDMNAQTFMRSIHALREYFPLIARAGREGQAFDMLKQLGLAAETGMLQATAGVNTHRGAIFVLGLLCAAAGRLRALSAPVTASALRKALRIEWGESLELHAAAVAHGGPGATRGRRRPGLVSAAEEAARGMPTLFDRVLPALRRGRASGYGEQAASVHALFVAMSMLDDTTVIQRGGDNGLAFVRASACEFLARGSVDQRLWRQQARELHAAFVARRLSPGGSADLLAAALWVDAVTQPEAARASPAVAGLFP